MDTSYVSGVLTPSGALQSAEDWDSVLVDSTTAVHEEAVLEINVPVRTFSLLQIAEPLSGYCDSLEDGEVE